MKYGHMSAMDRYEAVELYKQKRKKAIETLQQRYPLTSEWSKLMWAVVPLQEGGLEPYQARYCYVWMNPPDPWEVKLGVRAEEWPRLNGKTFRAYTCFDWHTGAWISHNRSRKAALNEAIIILQMYGKEAYDEFSANLKEQNGGENLND